MKKIMTVLMCLVVITAGAQTTVEKVVTTVSNAVDSGKQAVKETTHIVDTSSNFKLMYNDVKSGIMGMASALKVGAEHVYVVLVRQQVVKAVTNLVWITLLIICIIVFFRNMAPTLKHEGEDMPPEGLKMIISGALGIVLLLVVSLSGMIPETIMGLLNPEYGAMQDIVDMAKKLKQ